MSVSAGNSPFVRLRLNHRSDPNTIEGLRAVYAGMEVQRGQGKRFALDAVCGELPGLRFMAGHMSEVVFQRTREVKEAGDGFVLSVSDSGTAIDVGPRHEISISGGQAILVREDELGFCGLLTPLRGFSLRFTRENLAPLVRNLDDTAFRPVPDGDGAMRHLRAYITSLSGAPPATAELQRLISTHIHDLAALALGATRDGREQARQRGLKAARLAAIKADVIARLGAGPILLDDVADRHRISAVYVRKLFEADGTSFTEFVLEERLRRAHRMLQSPLLADRSIGTIAYDCGFGDLSYFNRAFRKRFGATPSDIRSDATSRR